jgi:hypothetical protein
MDKGQIFFLKLSKKITAFISKNAQTKTLAKGESIFIRKNFRAGHQDFDDGKFIIPPHEWLRKLEHAMQMGEIKDNTIKVSKLHFSLVDTLFETLEETNFIKEISDRKKSCLILRRFLPHPLLLLPERY